MTAAQTVMEIKFQNRAKTQAVAMAAFVEERMHPPAHWSFHSHGFCGCAAFMASVRFFPLEAKKKPTQRPKPTPPNISPKMEKKAPFINSPAWRLRIPLAHHFHGTLSVSSAISWDMARQ